MSRRPSAGFTLVELAVVLAIVGLLLGIVLVPLSTQFELRQIRAEEEALARIRDAILGFAAVNGRLPCPDTDSDGQENCTLPPACRQQGLPPPPPPPLCPTDQFGNLPYADLGVQAGDEWGRLRLYHIDYDFVLLTAPGTPPNVTNNLLDLGDLADRLSVTQRLSDKTTRALTRPAVNDGAVAVVVSLGSNGYGGNLLDGSAIAAPAPITEVDEPENRDGDINYVTRVRSGTNANPCDDDGTSGAPLAGFCEFDDLLMWIPRSEFMNRMIEAGRLP